jgi:signal transduction histidine kinase/CheY-like chemotaxis protein
LISNNNLKRRDGDLGIGRWNAEFLRPAVERAFRISEWADTIQAIRFALMVTFVAIWVGAYSDYLFVGWSPTLGLLFGVRVALSLLSIRLLSFGTGLENRHRIESLVPSMLAAAIILQLIITITRPAAYYPIIFTNLSLTYAVYLFAPTGLRQVTFLLTASTFANLLALLVRDQLSTREVVSTSILYFAANAFGFATARRLHTLRRTNFANRVVERRARRQLVAEIAERRRIEHQLVEAKRQAEEANAAKSAFLASMSHEIRTPLTGILGFAQLLADTKLTPVQAAHVQVIERSGRDLTRLLNDILDLSKVEAGRIQIVAAPFRLMELIDTTLRLIPQRAKTPKVPIRFVPDPDYDDLWLMGDAPRIKQILTNLLDNALKFSGGQPVDFLLRIANDGDISRLEFDVSDRGPGVPDASKTAIFEPYFTTPNMGASGVGAGLGLAICKRLIDAMGGRIEIADREGGGSSFRVYLALAQTNSPTAPSMTAEGDEPRALPTSPLNAQGALSVVDSNQATGTGAGSSASTDSDPTGLDVLLVDDDDVNRLLIGTVLTRLGHQVTMAMDGRQGVDLALSRRFDLVLMDIRMPVLNGGDAIRELRATSSPMTDNLPIFAMTANVMDQEVEEYRAAGADEVLAKPVDFVHLRQCMSRLAKTTRQAEASARPSVGHLISLIGVNGARNSLLQLSETVPVLLAAFIDLSATDSVVAHRCLERLAQALGTVGLSALGARALALKRDQVEAFQTEVMAAIEGLNRNLADYDSSPE